MSIAMSPVHLSLFAIVARDAGGVSIAPLIIATPSHNSTRKENAHENLNGPDIAQSIGKHG